MDIILGPFGNPQYNIMRLKRHLYGFDDIYAVTRPYASSWAQLIRTAMFFADHIVVLADDVAYPNPTAWNTSIELSMLLVDGHRAKSSIYVNGISISIDDVPGINDFDHESHVLSLYGCYPEIVEDWPAEWSNLTTLDVAIQQKQTISDDKYSSSLIYVRKQLYNDTWYNVVNTTEMS